MPRPTFEHQPQGIFRGHDQLRVLLDHLWYAKPGWFIGRQSVRIVKCMGEEVPWVGQDRARTNAPTGPII